MGTVGIGLLAIVPSVTVTTLFLGNSEKAFDIHVAPQSGKAIIDALGKEKIIRPTTHILLNNIATVLGHQISSATIHAMKDAIFFAKIRITNILHEERYMELDCKPTDAIILSIINDVPLLVTEELLDLVGKPKNQALRQKI